MAFSEQLVDRISNNLSTREDVATRKMFGGVCFMVSGHMCCGVTGDTLMARVGPDNYHAALQRPNAREMDFTGRSLKGFVYVEPAGIESEQQLSSWLELCLEFVTGLGPR